MGYPSKPVDTGLVSGQILLGKYRVESVLGQGGMGVVARCTHIALGEQVAIKMLRRDVMVDPDAVGRFMREAQAASKLKSEHVARVSDVGVFEDNVPYMVMEYLEGHDLDQLLEQRGVLPMAWATEMMLQTCEALAEAHSHGIVHRDVKPSNLFVTWRPDGSAIVKVLDFGISKSATTDLQLTQTQSLLGTPAYMSPEQMRSARLVDARTDIWSLGTVLYELLEGRRPFEAESFSEMCVKVAVDEPQPMVNTPPALQRVVLRCLAKTPESRYASVAELGRELAPFAPDAHQANKLVERMFRVLKRGGDWDPKPNPSLPGIPVPARPLDSRPVQSASMSDATPIDARAEARDARAGAQVTSTHVQTLTSRPHRRAPLVFAGSALAAVAIGIAVFAGVQHSRAQESATARPTVEPIRAAPASTSAPMPGPKPAPTMAQSIAPAPPPRVPAPTAAVTTPTPAPVGDIKPTRPTGDRPRAGKGIVKGATQKPMAIPAPAPAPAPAPTPAPAPHDTNVFDSANAHGR